MAMFRSLVLAFLMVFSMQLQAADDLLVADFEGADYQNWTVTGDAFGLVPAAGTLAGQMEVSGFSGKRLANSFNGGDGATGKLT